LIRPDDDADLAGVAPRQPLQLLARQLLRIDPDASLGAAERQVDIGVFHTHPGRQRHHLLECDLGVVTHASFAWAACQAVLHPVAFVVGDAAVVHLDRHIDDQHSLGPFERFGPARQRPQVRDHPVDLRQVSPPGAVGAGVDIGKRHAGTSAGNWAKSPVVIDTLA